MTGTKAERGRRRSLPARVVGLGRQVLPLVGSRRTDGPGDRSSVVEERLDWLARRAPVAELRAVPVDVMPECASAG